MFSVLPLPLPAARLFSIIHHFYCDENRFWLHLICYNFSFVCSYVLNLIQLTLVLFVCTHAESIYSIEACNLRILFVRKKRSWYLYIIFFSVYFSYDWNSLYSLWTQIKDGLWLAMVLVFAHYLLYIVCSFNCFVVFFYVSMCCIGNCIRESEFKLSHSRKLVDVAVHVCVAVLVASTYYTYTSPAAKVNGFDARHKAAHVPHTCTEIVNAMKNHTYKALKKIITKHAISRIICVPRAGVLLFFLCTNDQQEKPIEKH